MKSQSASLNDEVVANGQPDHSEQTRLTANSFRNLMDRLKKPANSLPPKEIALNTAAAPEKLTSQNLAVETGILPVKNNPSENTQRLKLTDKVDHKVSAQSAPVVKSERALEAVMESLPIASPTQANVRLEDAFLTEETMLFPESEAAGVEERSVASSAAEKIKSDELSPKEVIADTPTASASPQKSGEAEAKPLENLLHPTAADEASHQSIKLEEIKRQEVDSPQLAEWQEIEQPAPLKPDDSAIKTEELIPLPPVASTEGDSRDHSEDHDIIEISKAIYAIPSFAERSAFLVEIAALAVAEARKEKIPGPVKQKSPPDENPFATIALSGLNDSSRNLENENSGELALSLLDMMLTGPKSGQPQERTLAADALLKIIPHTPLKVMISITNRVALMKSPPPLLLTKLINDPRLEVVGPLLENCHNISDDILSRTIANGQVNLQRLIARRLQVSSALTDQLLTYGDASVILTLVRNTGALFSHQGFLHLVRYARENPQLLAPLVTRTDLQAPIAFELFWSVPTELRRFILSRFLTDSETLTKILKITQVMQGTEQGLDVRVSDNLDTDEFLAFLQQARYQEAASKLAAIASIHLETALRIVLDKSGEPLAIVMKALNISRARFGEVISDLKASECGIIKEERQASELQSIFDLMSLNKVRVILTYWDWAALQTGPYALPH